MFDRAGVLKEIDIADSLEMIIEKIYRRKPYMEENRKVTWKETKELINKDKGIC